MIPGIPNKKFVLVRAKEIMGWQTLVANSQTSATPSSRVHIMSPPLFHSGLTFWKGIGCRQKCSVSDQRLLISSIPASHIPFVLSSASHTWQPGVYQADGE